LSSRRWAVRSRTSVPPGPIERSRREPNRAPWPSIGQETRGWPGP
jgi:hypothetical protein